MKAVLFDMDGVLIDSEIFYMEGTLKWMRELGYTGTFEEVCEIIGTTMNVTYEMIVELLEHRYTMEEVRKINVTYFTEHPLEFPAVAKPGSLELLKRCKELGLQTALCSSSSRKAIDAAVQGCGFGPYLDFIVSGEQFKESKPHPEIYLHAAGELNLKPEDCVVVEDSQYGIEAGKAAGMKVVALCDHRLPNKQDEADIIVDHLNEVKELVEKWA
ncbi:HAD family hydrolase [Anaerorhabdus sp.]|uniref:HAD family hydrolase n=1 Tax=Anaerorhabdus sp. TaxID=1872524 RepID=UPI002FC8E3CE